VYYDGAKPQSCIVEIFCTMGGQKSVVPAGHSDKNFSFHFKCYNLTIRVVKCRETFCTCFHSSLVQDPTVESAKKRKRIHLGFLSYKWQIWSVFEEKHPLVL
jgi:hypothetical protein